MTTCFSAFITWLVLFLMIFFFFTPVNLYHLPNPFNTMLEAFWKGRPTCTCSIHHFYPAVIVLAGYSENYITFWGCSGRVPWIGWFKQQKSHSLETWKTVIKVCSGLVSSETFLLQLQIPIPLSVFTWSSLGAVCLPICYLRKVTSHVGSAPAPALKAPSSRSVTIWNERD